MTCTKRVCKFHRSIARPRKKPAMKRNDTPLKKCPAREEALTIPKSGYKAMGNKLETESGITSVTQNKAVTSRTDNPLDASGYLGSSSRNGNRMRIGVAVAKTIITFRPPGSWSGAFDSASSFASSLLSKSNGLAPMEVRSSRGSRLKTIGARRPVYQISIATLEPNQRCSKLMQCIKHAYSVQKTLQILQY